jgi:hypothetical protein
MSRMRSNRARKIPVRSFIRACICQVVGEGAGEVTLNCTSSYKRLLDGSQSTLTNSAMPHHTIFPAAHVACISSRIHRIHRIYEFTRWRLCSSAKLPVGY